ncbi:MAG: hypothetical protein IJW03_00790 [Clostridia bacterium]|nr:hypothetical protein [Clostridia bacterium]
MDISQIDKNFALPVINEPDIEWIDARDERFALYGVYFDETEDAFVRMPSDVAKATNDGVAALFRHTSGGRIRFTTDSPYVALKAVVTKPGVMRNITMIGMTGFGVYSDGKYLGPIIPDYAAMARTEGGRAGVSGIVRMCSGEHNMEVYMPLYNGTFSVYIGIKKGSVLKPYRYTDTRRVMYYGSSITQGGCASHPGNDYAAMLSRMLDIDYLNLGFSGSARGEAVMCDYLARQECDVFVLDYDHNAPNAKHLLDTHYPLYETVRRANPTLPIVMMSRPDFRGDTDSIARRDAIRATYERALSEGDSNVYYIDGETLFDGDMRDSCTVDGCHPNDLGFFRMAQVVYPVLKNALE